MPKLLTQEEIIYVKFVIEKGNKLSFTCCTEDTPKIGDILEMTHDEGVATVAVTEISVTLKETKVVCSMAIATVKALKAHYDSLPKP